ncbi:MAG: hypothetical protein K2X01_08705 [Cyanobacteria bacterium]|nr:hypothetical protein [Cyanobacteriota bacterium]
MTLTLENAQEIVYSQSLLVPQTTQQALMQLQHHIQRCLAAYEAEKTLETQQVLEDILVSTLIAMKTLNISAEQALSRWQARQKSAATSRLIKLWPDRLEVWVDGRPQGGWPLYSEQEYQSASTLAAELGCRLEYAEVDQGRLFS